MRLVLVFLLALPLPAAAHAILMESQPTARATLPAGIAHLRLRFNSRIDQARSRLELRGASTTVLPLGTSMRPDTLESDATLVPGAWTLHWQVLAVDGHITRGDIPITVQAP